MPAGLKYMPEASSTTPMSEPAIPTPRADWRSTAIPAARAEPPATAARPTTANMSFFIMCMCLSWSRGQGNGGGAPATDVPIWFCPAAVRAAPDAFGNGWRRKPCRAEVGTLESALPAPRLVALLNWYDQNGGVEIRVGSATTEPTAAFTSSIVLGFTTTW